MRNVTATRLRERHVAGTGDRPGLHGTGWQRVAARWSCAAWQWAGLVHACAVCVRACVRCVRACVRACLFVRVCLCARAQVLRACGVSVRLRPVCRPAGGTVSLARSGWLARDGRKLGWIVGGWRWQGWGSACGFQNLGGAEAGQLPQPTSPPPPPPRLCTGWGWGGDRLGVGRKSCRAHTAAPGQRKRTVRTETLSLEPFLRASLTSFSDTFCAVFSPAGPPARSEAVMGIIGP